MVLRSRDPKVQQKTFLSGWAHVWAHTPDGTGKWGGTAQIITSASKAPRLDVRESHLLIWEQGTAEMLPTEGGDTRHHCCSLHSLLA